jgi:hypothetical protein
MKRLTRALLAAAAVGLSAGAARAADIQAVLPADTEQIVNINVRQILDSELIKKYALGNLKQALEGNEAQKTLKQLGLDPLKDIERVTGGLWGENAQEMKALFVVSGKFDPKKLFEAAEEAAKKDGDKVAIVKDGDYTLVKATVKNRPDPVYLSVADESTVVIGTEKKLVTDAMKASGEKSGKPAIKKELAELFAKMDPKASVYACGVASGKVGDIPPNPLFDDPAKLKKQLEKLANSTLTVRVSTDIAVEVVMGMKDKDAADDFGGTVDELLNKIKVFIPLAAMQNANLKPVTNELTKTLKSSVKEQNIVISAKVTGEAIGKAAGSDD